jgi:hypothetical protein
VVVESRVDMAAKTDSKVFMIARGMIVVATKHPLRWRSNFQMKRSSLS